MKILVYARCSRGRNEQTPEAQVDAINAYIAGRQWTNATVQTFVDSNQSGAKDSRPALDAMLAEVRGGTATVVVVYKLDRLGRSLKHLLAMLSEFQSFGTDFVSVTEVIDTSTAQGKLLFSILGAFSEFERSLTCERIANGLAYAGKHGTRSQREHGANGKSIGRPRRIIDRERVLSMRRDGASLRDIATSLHTSLGKVHAIAKAAASSC